MNSRLWIDIETYSSVDLTKYGVYRYAASEDFMILMAAWSTDGKTVQVAIGPGQIKNIPGLLDHRVTKVAHNAQFERVCFSRFLGLPPGEYLPPEDWYDTQAVAAEHGYPQSLSNLARALGGEQKDEAGTRLINIFCKPNRKGTRTLPEEKPAEWLDFIFYCEQDVHSLISVDGRMSGWPNEIESDIFHADQSINDRGIAINLPMAEAAKKESELNQEEQKERFREITGVENPNSVQQVGAWLEREGIEAKNLRAETVTELLEGDNLTEDQREALELRQELALVASKKYATALNSHVGGRLRGTLKFFGAHTGRWAGRGTQIQNLPRSAFDNTADTELAIQDLFDPEERVSAEELKKLVRPMFDGPFTVVDYSAIEARVIAWLAGESWALEAFALGRDIYVETAERMGGLTRSQGKIAVLALGFGGGAGSLRAMAGGEDSIVMEGEDAGKPRNLPGLDDIEEVVSKRILDLTNEEIMELLVTPWRRANPKIVQLWNNLGNAFAEAGQVGPHLRTEESHDRMGRTIELHLPSGRSIKYHNTLWERYVVKDPKSGKIIKKVGWRYASSKNPFNSNSRIGTYGGSLAENATQAVARDLLAEALVRLENRGYRVVGHVHDEILVEGEHDVDHITEIMTQLPDWATGLPMGGEGFVCRRYRKG